MKTNRIITYGILCSLLLGIMGSIYSPQRGHFYGSDDSGKEIFPEIILNPVDVQPRAAATKEWTVMVYLDADNNLEAMGIDDLNEMEIVGTTGKINIVVQIDRTAGYDTSNGDWTGARRYEVTKDTGSSIISSNLVQDLGEVNMGAQATLDSFVSWGKTNYPANRYALILWDHGSGPLWGPNIGGVCWDDTDGYDYLTPQEVYNSLATYPVDLVGFDACLMGSAEIFYQVKDLVDVVIGSEKVEPGDGYPYNTILGWLASFPTASAESLGQEVVENYYDSYPSYWEVTQTAVRTSGLNALGSAVNALALEILGYGTFYNPAVTAARDASLHFDDNPFIDLFDFCTNLKTQIGDATIQTLATNVQNAITSTIVAEAHTPSLAGAHGISIYFPDDASSYRSTYESYLFCTGTAWDEFIKNALAPTTQDDGFEENDAPSTASEIIAGTYTLLRINASDSDYYNITLSPGDEISVSVDYETPNDEVLDIFLSNPLGTQVASSSGSTGYESLSYTTILPGNHTIRVNPTAATAQLIQYCMVVDAPLVEDIYEINMIGENDEMNNATALTTNQTYSNLVGQDDDYYKFSVPEGNLINISATFATGQGDLDLYLYDYDLRLISSSETASNEIILNGSVNGALSEKTYYLHVAIRRVVVKYAVALFINDVDDSYDVGIGNEYTGFETKLDPGTYTDLVCIDKDFYNVTLTSGQWLNATILFKHAGGDLDLILYDPDGYSVAWAISKTDDEILLYKASDNGNYTLFVDPVEINLNYTLVLALVSITDDGFESNDFFEDAASITFGETYNNLASWNWDFYQVTIPAGVRFSIEIEFDHALGDLDLYIFAGSFDNLVDGSTGVDNLERVTWTPQASATTLQILVYNNYEPNPSYTLRTRENTFPDANFTASPASGPGPLTVTFTDTSTSSDGIVGWGWDFDDGNTSTEQNPTHTFYTAAAYLVELEVVDNDGDTTTTILQVRVTIPGTTPNPNGDDETGPDIPGYPILILGAAIFLVTSAILRKLRPRSRVQG